MKFTEFFKLYYEITDREFSDRIIWNAHSDNHKKAVRKGQNPRKSKLERKILIFLQYLELVFAVLYSVINRTWIVSLFGFVLFLLSVFITNFSFTVIFKLFLSLNKSVYSQIWLQLFYGNFDLSYLTKLTKQKTNGYYSTRKLCFQLPSKIIATSKNNRISIKFSIKKVKVTVNNENFIIDNQYDSINTLIEDIANLINKTPQLS